MVEGCERCDGRGCRYCSGRGWVERATELLSTCRKDYPRTTLQDIDEMSDWPTARPARAGGSHGRTKEDRDQDHGEVEQPSCCVFHRSGGAGHLSCGGDTASLKHPADICPDCGMAICPDCGMDYHEPPCDDEPEVEPEVEPDERIRITVQYPDHRVKLLRVRYGTLSQALAEAFNGRPWS